MGDRLYSEWKSSYWYGSSRGFGYLPGDNVIVDEMSFISNVAPLFAAQRG